jgi:protein-disulfide isomerase
MKRSLPFIIIALVALLTVGIGAALYRAKQSPASQSVVAATPAEQSENGSLHVRGPRNAPVTVEIFGDFQCPSCATASQAIDELAKQYGSRLRVIFREFPLAMHAHAVDAALAAEAAGLQGRFWEMHDMLYQLQSSWTKASSPPRFFELYARQLGLDVERFRADAQNPEVRARVIAEGESGVARGVKNTPTIFVNGSEVRSAFNRENLQAAIETALAEKKQQ